MKIIILILIYRFRLQISHSIHKFQGYIAYNKENKCSNLLTFVKRQISKFTWYMKNFLKGKFLEFIKIWKENLVWSIIINYMHMSKI